MTMLTRKQLESAARYLCKMRNVHPDNTVFIDKMGVSCQAWESAAREIEAHELLTEAIRYGKEATDTYHR